MASLLGPSGALWTVRVLFGASLVASIGSFLTDHYLHSQLKTYWKPILLCAVLTVLWRIPFWGHFFHGMEYEDAYVYTVAGRQMAEHDRIGPTEGALPYSITVCAVGSLMSCQESENFPEHLIGYPYVLSLWSTLFGYRPSIGSLANLTAALFADIFIFLLGSLVARDTVAAGSAALIFAITPVFAVWGLETSAEPFSNVCITLVLWFCLRHIAATSSSESRRHDFTTWVAFTATLLYSLTIKRENVLLPICLPIVACSLQIAMRRTNRFPIRNAHWVAFSAALGLALSVHMEILQTMGGETALLNRFPITVTEVVTLATTFLRSFFIAQWYGGVAILVLTGLLVAMHRKGLELVPLVLFVAYVLLYAFHIRSYYEMQSGNADPRAALRFSMSLMSLWSILAGIGAAFIIRSIWRWIAAKSYADAVKWVAAGAVAIVIGVSYFACVSLREDATEDEFQIRIGPSLAIAQSANNQSREKTYILTLEPLVAQMYSVPTVNVVDLADLDGSAVQQIGLSEGAASILYLDEAIHQTAADRDRYKSQMACLDLFQRRTLTSNAVFSIVSIAAGVPDRATSNGRPGRPNSLESGFALPLSVSVDSIK